MKVAPNSCPPDLFFGRTHLVHAGLSQIQVLAAPDSLVPQDSVLQHSPPAH